MGARHRLVCCGHIFLTVMPTNLAVFDANTFVVYVHDLPESIYCPVYLLRSEPILEGMVGHKFCFAAFTRRSDILGHPNAGFDIELCDFLPSPCANRL